MLCEVERCGKYTSAPYHVIKDGRKHGICDRCYNLWMIHGQLPVFPTMSFDPIRMPNNTTKDDKCPDCKGSKVYVGLTTTEPCRACGGTGKTSGGSFEDFKITVDHGQQVRPTEKWMSRVDDPNDWNPNGSPVTPAWRNWAGEKYDGRMDAKTLATIRRGMVMYDARPQRATATEFMMASEHYRRQIEEYQRVFLDFLQSQGKM